MPTPRAIPTDENLRDVYEFFAQRAIELFNETGAVHPAIFAIVLDDDHDGAICGALEAPAEIARAIYNSPGKAQKLNALLDMFLGSKAAESPILKESGIDTPTLVVTIVEAWFAGPSKDENLAEKEKFIPVSQREDKSEVVAVTLYTRHKTYMGTCHVVTTPKRHCVYSPLIINESLAIEGGLVRESPPSENPGITLH